MPMQGTTAEIISEIHSSDPCRLHEGARTVCCTDCGTRFFQPGKFQYRTSRLDQREKVKQSQFLHPLFQAAEGNIEKVSV